MSLWCTSRVHAKSHHHNTWVNRNTKDSYYGSFQGLYSVPWLIAGLNAVTDESCRMQLSPFRPGTQRSFHFFGNPEDRTQLTPLHWEMYTVPLSDVIYISTPLSIHRPHTPSPSSAHSASLSLYRPAVTECHPIGSSG